MKKAFVLTLLAVALLVPGRAVAQEREVILCFGNAVSELAKELVEKVENRAVLADRTFAVGSFPDSRDRVLPFSRYLGEALIGQLQATGAFKGAVERSRQKQLLEELGRGMSAVYDETRVKELGKQVGADYVVLGSITALKASRVIGVKVRLVAVETGIAAHTAERRILKEPAFEELLEPASVLPPETPPGKGSGKAKGATTDPGQPPATEPSKPGPPDLKPYLAAGGVVLIVLAVLVAMTKRKDAPASAAPAPGGEGASGIACGRCGSKIETDGQIAGQCTAPGCPTPICQACWAKHKDDRRCFQHTKE